jgi:hypothetical protein
MTDHPSEQSLAATVPSMREELLGLDLRSLALLRIGLASVIIADLCDRSRDLAAHYTDWGIWPRFSLLEKFFNPWYWSIHLINGKTIFVALLFGIQILLALGLLIGYRTRLLAFLSWVFLVSLQNRNLPILGGGDIELHLLLFWGLFLPLGACYSGDRALNTSAKPLPERVLSWGTVALTLQICFIYWFAWALKTDPIWRVEGSAVYYALNIDSLATPLGHYLLNFPSLLVFFNFATLALELLGPFLLFVPLYNDFFRLCAIILFISLHVGFGLTMSIGNFPWIGAMAWLVFLPSSFWNRLSQRLRTPQREGLRIYYDKNSNYAEKLLRLLQTFLLLPETCLTPIPDTAEIQDDRLHWFAVDWQGTPYRHFQAALYLCRLSPLFRPLSLLLQWQPISKIGTKLYNRVARDRRLLTRLTAPLKFRPLQVEIPWAANICALLLLIYVFFWNLNTLAPDFFKLPIGGNAISLALRLDQKWDMFAPYPFKDDGWYVIPGKLKDGTEIDVFRNGAPVSWEKPKWVPDLYPNERWRKYLENLWTNENYRLYYAQYLCRNWNSQNKGNQKLDTFEIFYMLERTLPNYQPPKLEKISLWKHYCFEQPKVLAFYLQFRLGWRSPI